METGKHKHSDWLNLMCVKRASGVIPVLFKMKKTKQKTKQTGF